MQWVQVMEKTCNLLKFWLWQRQRGVLSDKMLLKEAQRFTSLRFCGMMLLYWFAMRTDSPLIDLFSEVSRSWVVANFGSPLRCFVGQIPVHDGGSQLGRTPADGCLRASQCSWWVLASWSLWGRFKWAKAGPMLMFWHRFGSFFTTARCLWGRNNCSEFSTALVRL